MTITIPGVWVILAAVAVLITVAFSSKAGPFRYLAAAAIFLAGAYWLREPPNWLALALAAVGVLFVLGFVDAVRAKK